MTDYNTADVGQANMNVNSCKSNDTGSADRTLVDRPYDMEQLVRRCMGKIELAERLLNSFESRFPEDLSKIEDSLREYDSPTASRMVHQLKGAAANVSAPDLYKMLARLEDVVRVGQYEQANDCVGEIHQKWRLYTNSSRVGTL
jgi:HPt (histidine-containing phosphotransfer) domain-containing protein